MAAQKAIRSLEDARKRIPVILGEINADPQLALLAGVNPILALEDLGYVVSPEARVEIEEYVRFGPAKAARLRELRDEIFRIANHSFDLQSEEALASVLGGKLNLQVPRQAGEIAVSKSQFPSVALGLLPQVRWRPKTEDALETLRDAHPIIGPLLEYRRLEASEPRFGSRELYEDIRQGKRRTPVVTLRGKLKSRAP